MPDQLLAKVPEIKEPKKTNHNRKKQSQASKLKKRIDQNRRKQSVDLGSGKSRLFDDNDEASGDWMGSSAAVNDVEDEVGLDYAAVNSDWRQSQKVARARSARACRASDIDKGVYDKLEAVANAYGVLGFVNDKRNSSSEFCHLVSAKLVPTLEEMGAGKGIRKLFPKQGSRLILDLASKLKKWAKDTEIQERYSDRNMEGSSEEETDEQIDGLSGEEIDEQIDGLSEEETDEQIDGYTPADDPLILNELINYNAEVQAFIAKTQDVYDPMVNTLMCLIVYFLVFYDKGAKLQKPKKPDGKNPNDGALSDDKLGDALNGDKLSGKEFAMKGNEKTVPWQGASGPDGKYASPDMRRETINNGNTFNFNGNFGMYPQILGMGGGQTPGANPMIMFMMMMFVMQMLIQQMAAVYGDFSQFGGGLRAARVEEEEVASELAAAVPAKMAPKPGNLAKSVDKVSVDVPPQAAPEPEDLAKSADRLSTVSPKAVQRPEDISKAAVRLAATVPAKMAPEPKVLTKAASELAAAVPATEAPKPGLIAAMVAKTSAATAVKTAAKPEKALPEPAEPAEEAKPTEISPKCQELINKWVSGLRPVIRLLALIASRGGTAVREETTVDASLPRGDDAGTDSYKPAEMHNSEISQEVKDKISQLIKDGDELMEMLLKPGSKHIIAMSRYDNIEKELSNHIQSILSLILKGKKHYGAHYSIAEDVTDLNALMGIQENLPKNEYKLTSEQEAHMSAVIDSYCAAYPGAKNNPIWKDIYDNEANTFKHFFSGL
ncbi:MAG: hypothetical protein LBR79_02700 [Oscillospiraceae bacterium]|jgi:hypothetical protein|nr:hypothetical protein [Oscillospiraceae bacterium]